MKKLSSYQKLKQEKEKLKQEKEKLNRELQQDIYDLVRGSQIEKTITFMRWNNQFLAEESFWMGDSDTKNNTKQL